MGETPLRISARFASSLEHLGIEITCEAVNVQLDPMPEPTGQLVSPLDTLGFEPLEVLHERLACEGLHKLDADIDVAVRSLITADEAAEDLGHADAVVPLAPRDHVVEQRFEFLPHIR